MVVLRTMLFNGNFFQNLENKTQPREVLLDHPQESTINSMCINNPFLSPFSTILVTPIKCRAKSMVVLDLEKEEEL